MIYIFLTTVMPKYPFILALLRLAEKRFSIFKCKNTKKDFNKQANQLKKLNDKPVLVVTIQRKGMAGYQASNKA